MQGESKCGMFENVEGGFRRAAYRGCGYDSEDIKI